ncbi:MAG: RNA polymerase sigma factor (TIGR02999 family) [Planctomycetota bacterium]|jgi:RNA polymerase sigma factor (TIGR02999 family)
MTPPDDQNITRLLRDAREGRAGAAESLLPLVYSELRGLANAAFSGERVGHTLQPTALIHEAWMKLAGHLGHIEDRRHFFIIASRGMRQVLTDHARRGLRQKRGDGDQRVTLDGHLDGGSDAAVDLIDLNDSLDQLARLNPRHAQVVELRILGGLTIAETAEALAVSHATVETDWFTAKAWLRTKLRAPDDQ